MLHLLMLTNETLLLIVLPNYQFLSWLLIYQMILVPNSEWRWSILKKKWKCFSVTFGVIIHSPQAQRERQFPPSKDILRKLAHLPEMSFRVCFMVFTDWAAWFLLLTRVLEWPPCKFEHRNFMMKPAAFIHLYMCSSNI